MPLQFLLAVFGRSHAGHAFEYLVEIRGVVKAAGVANVVDAFYRVAQQGFGQFDPFRVDKIYGRDAQFIFEAAEKMRLAHAGLFAEHFDAERIVQVFAYKMDHKGQPRLV